MKHKCNNGVGCLIWSLMYIIPIVVIGVVAYLIAVSDLLEWFKYFLLK